MLKLGVQFAQQVEPKHGDARAYSAERLALQGGSLAMAIPDPGLLKGEVRFQIGDPLFKISNRRHEAKKTKNSISLQ